LTHTELLLPSNSQLTRKKLTPSHGVPHSRKLLTLANRGRIASEAPAAAREQLTIAIEMIDAIEIQIGPVDLALRAIARTQPAVAR